MINRGTLCHQFYAWVFKKVKFCRTQVYEFFFQQNLIELMGGGNNLVLQNELESYSNTKDLPKEYLILKFKSMLNDDLLNAKIISFDIYNRMQKNLLNKMDKIKLEYMK